MKFLPHLKIAQKLPLALIGSALLVGLGIGAAAYLIGLQTVDQQRQQRMDASIQSGLDQVQAYFDNVAVDLKLFATRADTVTQIENMTRAFTALNIQGNGTSMLQASFITNDPYRVGEKILSDTAGQTAGDYDGQHRRFHPGWRTVLQERGYDDIMLFNPDGILIYTAEKYDDFVTDFSKGSGNPLSEGDLGKLLRRTAAMPAGSIAFADFSIYAPAGGKPESFIATPVYKADKLAGVLVFEISAKSISDKVSSIRGLGETGEALIVGPDGLMRTQSHFSTDPNVLITPIHSDIVTTGMNGERSSGIVSGYRGQDMVALAAPFQIDETKWAVLAVQSQAEVMAPVTAMRNAMLLVGGALLLLAAIAGLLFSRSVTKPISSLTGTMQALAGGDLGVEVKGSGRSDEIGEMARTVEVFRE
ncbi:MAG: cache and HAMP domain-containing protein, partial [Devosia sp.]